MLLIFCFIRYYSFDKIFIREFLGKKLSSRLRKEIEEIGEKVKISPRSCRRQVSKKKNIFSVNWKA